MVVAGIEQQDHECRAERRGDPYRLFHVEVFEREEAADRIVVRGRQYAHHTRRDKQQVEYDGHAVDTLEQ